MKLIETIHKYFSMQETPINENMDLIDSILDKISEKGQSDMSYDERIYLKQYKEGNINKDLEKWLLSDDELTFDMNGDKLLFDEFAEDEDILYNKEKLKRIITKHLNKNPFTNNADWGDGYVWNLKSTGNFEGVFLYLGDDELVVIDRVLVDDEYQDKLIKSIDNSTDLYKLIKSLNKTSV